MKTKNLIRKTGFALLGFAAVTVPNAAHAVDSEIVTEVKAKIAAFTVDLTAIGIAIIAVSAVAAVILLGVKWMKKH